MMNISDNKGQAVIMLVMVLGATILGISTVVGFITLQKIRTATDAADSSKAIYAADAGVERCFYEKFGPGGTATSTCDFAVGDMVFSNGAGVEVIDNVDVIKSIGRAGRTYRAFGIFLSPFSEE